MIWDFVFEVTHYGNVDTILIWPWIWQQCSANKQYVSSQVKQVLLSFLRSVFSDSIIVTLTNIHKWLKAERTKSFYSKFQKCHAIQWTPWKHALRFHWNQKFWLMLSKKPRTFVSCTVIFFFIYISSFNFLWLVSSFWGIKRVISQKILYSKLLEMNM